MVSANNSAGRAYVEIVAKNQVRQGTLDAQRDLKAFATAVHRAGLASLAAGTAISSGLTAAVTEFVSVGGQVNDAMERSGLSAEFLSSLGAEAEHFGGSVDSIAAASNRLGKQAREIASGNEAAIARFEELGIAAEEFLGASPEQRMRLVADALANIADPGLRAAAAMKLFGGNGQSILPVLASGSVGMDAMVASAKSLGLALDDNTAKSADTLGDSFGSLKQQVAALGVAVGSALAPILIPAVAAMQKLLGAGIAILKNNPGLTKGLAVAAGVLLAVGAGLVAAASAGAIFASVGSAIAFAISAATGAIAVAGTVLAAILSPVGLVVAGVVAVGAALAAGAYLWVRYTASGRAAWTSLVAGVTVVAREVKRVLGGIFASLASGDLGLAANLAWAGIKVAFAAGVEGATKSVGSFLRWMIRAFADVSKRVTEFLLAPIRDLAATVDRLNAALGVSSSLASSVTSSPLIDAVAGAATGVLAGVEAGAAARTAAATKELESLLARVKTLEASRVAEANAAVGYKVSKIVSLPLGSGGAALGAFSAAAAVNLPRGVASVFDEIKKHTKRGADAAERAADADEDIRDDVSFIRRHGGLEFA